MLYYQFEYDRQNSAEESEAKARKIDSAEILKTSQHFNSKFVGKARFYLSTTDEDCITLCAAVERQQSAAYREFADAFMAGLGIKGRRVSDNEITIAQFLALLAKADRNSYLDDDDEVKRELGLDSFFTYRANGPKEQLIVRTYSQKQAEKQCNSLLCASSVLPELARIFAENVPPQFLSHPVHYQIVSDDETVRLALREMLLGSLLAAGRLQSRRICFVAPQPGRPGKPDFDIDVARTIYKAQSGGTVILRPWCADECGSITALPQEDLKQVGALACEHRRDVLTVLELPRRAEALIRDVAAAMENIPLVRLEEETVPPKTASAYLNRKARANGILKCKSLQSILLTGKSHYLTAELNQIYDNWYDTYLRTNVYAQYRDLPLSCDCKQAAPENSALAQLESMIGLTEVKAMVHQMVDSHRAQKLFEVHGVQSVCPAMHMVFTGNPGTAKTSVARLVAQILRDNGLLSVGNLIEAGRADLVDRYIGGTAPRVRALFERAKGSVLFIDEAYSLVDNRRGSYGDEAINTIVQEMENIRGDTAVIFAGYPDQMEEFLRTNPGLRSRIAYQIPFADYSQTELATILRLLAKQAGMQIKPAAFPKIDRILSKAMREKDFGNGRFVRTLFEQARMKQASRLMKLGQGNISKEDLLTMTIDDFDLPIQKETEKAGMPIGFQL